MAAAKAADRVVLVLGNSNCVENEAADRIPSRAGIHDQNVEHYMPDGGSSGPLLLPTGTSLPGNQEKLALAILALGKPTAVVLISGEGIAIDALMAPADALLWHGYPGATGGTAIAESILGRHNRFGRLPMSWMSKSFEAAVEFGDFDFAKLGRSYRYSKRVPLARFGDGMSARKSRVPLFAAPTLNAIGGIVGRAMAAIRALKSSLCAAAGGRGGLKSAQTILAGLSFSDHKLTVVPPPTQCDLIYGVTVTTTAGQLAGDVVVMGFLEPKRVSGLQPGTPVPVRQLVGVRRVSKEKDGSAKVFIELDAEAMKLTAIDGTRAVRDGEYDVVFSSGVAGGEVSVPLQLHERAANCRPHRLTTAKTDDDIAQTHESLAIDSAWEASSSACPANCSLAGACSAAGLCTCDAPFSGEACERLDQLPGSGTRARPNPLALGGAHS